MMLDGKVAVVFGGSGAIGSAAAHALAREGATVHLGARSLVRLDQVAQAIRASGGRAETFAVDVLNAEETAARVKDIAERNGLDVVVNTTSFIHDQGREITNLSLDEFMQCITPFLTAQFTIAKATARFMGGQRGGVLISVVAPAAHMAMAGHVGHIVACAGVEACTRALAAELGPRNVRVVCVRSHAIPEALRLGSYTTDLLGSKAAGAGLSVENWMNAAAASTMLNRLPTLSEVAGTIVFLTSSNASSMTGCTINMTAGAAI
jgi:NAD(P)-dependent dehydrogenase (short-subunit alcohol dehydrogenase family)